MPTTEALLRAALTGGGARLVLTLDRAFQGLPETAHGGTVLAALDAAAAVTGPRRITGAYRRRVPLAMPLELTIRRERSTAAVLLRDPGGHVLVEGEAAPGGEAPGDPSSARATSPVAADWSGAEPLPISRSCFACGVDNPAGLRARLAFDAEQVACRWRPGPRFADDGAPSTALAITTLLDETAFWLGALATGEAGMTTELRVTLHREPTDIGALTVVGARAAVSADPDDPRYWRTRVDAVGDAGQLVASAAITFVAVRGAARRLVDGMLALNAPDVLARVFPAYTR
jgi:acyl-coenzyme A thioesterase PaaI-like protein